MKSKNLILFFGILLLINLVDASYYYNVNMVYNRGDIKINNIEIISYDSLVSSSGDYSLVILDNSRKITEKYFNVPIISISEDLENESGETLVAEQVNFSVLVPYYVAENSNYRIVLYNNSRLLKNYSINELLNKNEASNVDLESNKVNDFLPLNKQDKKSNYFFIIFIILILVLFILIILFYFFKKKYF